MSAVGTAHRVERLVARLPQAGVDALLITDLINLRYLTGYVGSNGVAVIGTDTRAFATDFRYLEQMVEQVDETFDRHELPRNLVAGVEPLLPQGELRLGFETSLPVRIHTRLAEILPDRVELVPVDGLVEQMRSVKEPEEVEQIRAASALADEAFEQVIARGLVGRTEWEVALDLEFTMRRTGAELASFEPVVAAGPHGARPHAAPRPVEIPPDQMVVIDWGAQLDGYCSDCTRTVATGDPGSEAREVYDLVRQAQQVGLDATRAEAEERAVDAAARAVIESGGHGEHFGHALGHGVGLAVHEEPRLSPRSEERLQPGHVVTVEPGIYLPGRFGIRIEDVVVVGEEGCEILTGISKELMIAGR